MTSSENIRQLVRESPHTHREAANAIGMDYHLFSRAMAGSVDFTPAQIEKISAFLESKSSSPKTAKDSSRAVSREVKNMTKCPRCGEMNESSRFTCSKCYASLKTVQSKVQTKPKEALARQSLLASLRGLSFFNQVSIVGAFFCIAAAIVLPPGDEERLKALSQVAAMIVATCGLVGVMATGGIDLSIAGVSSLAAMLAVFAGKQQPVLGLIVGLATGVFAGWANGVLITRLRFQSVVLTLSLGVGLSAVVLSYARNDPSFASTSAFAWMTSSFAFFPVSLLLAAATAFGVKQWMGKQDFSIDVPQSAGIFRGSPLATEQAYMLSGACAGLAGVMLASIGQNVVDLAQSGWHLFPLAAAVAGGAVVRECRASVAHAVIGGVIVGTITWYISNIGVSSMQLLLAAVMLVGLIALDRSKEATWAQVRTAMRAQPRTAMMNGGAGLAVVAASYGIVFDAATRVPPESAVVVNTAGTVSVRRSQESGFEVVRANAGRVILRSHSAVRTGPQSAAMVKLTNGSVVKVSSSTELEFGEICQLSGQTLLTRMRMNFGRMYAKVQEVASGDQNFEVQTPTAVAAVRGTMWSIASAGGNDYVSVNDGLVDVTASQNTKRVAKGQATRVVGGAAPLPPEDMSWEERSAWAQEERDLNNPGTAKLWEQSQQSKFVADSFESATLNPNLWYLRGDANVTVKPSGGQLFVSGPAPTGVSSYGALTLPFSTGASPVIEGQVDMANRGTGTAIFRLTDRRGSDAGVALIFEGRDVTMRSADAADQPKQIRGFRGENVRLHRASLRYDASTGMAVGTVNGDIIGSLPVRFQDKKAHFELLSDGFVTGKSVDTRFDDFRTNVILPESDLATRFVAIGTRSGSNTPTNIVGLAPFSDKAGFRNVIVRYPKRSASGMQTRLLVQGTMGEAELKFDATARAFMLEEVGVMPMNGDFVFKILPGEGKQELPIQSLKYAEPTELPKVILQASKVANGQMSVTWTPVLKADAYWLEIIDDARGVPMLVTPLLGSHATSWTGMPVELTQGKNYYVRLVAHRFHERASTANRETWQQALKPLAKWLAPTSSLFVTVESPHGQDEFVTQATARYTW